MFKQKLAAVIMAAGLGSLVSVAPDRAILPTFAWPSFQRSYSRGKGRKSTAKPTGAAAAQRDAQKRKNQRKRPMASKPGKSRGECWL